MDFEIQAPVLLFKGEGLSDFLHQIIDVLAEEFPNAQIEQLPGGHAPHIISADQFMDIFTKFLAKSQKKQKRFKPRGVF